MKRFMNTCNQIQITDVEAHEMLNVVSTFTHSVAAVTIGPMAAVSIFYFVLHKFFYLLCSAYVVANLLMFFMNDITGNLCAIFCGLQ